MSSTDNSCAVAGVKKIYTMGRFSHGDFVFMPDNRTVYMADYNATGGFFQFVADNENDYDSGTLSAAKFTATDRTFNSYGIEWIELGKAN